MNRRRVLIGSLIGCGGLAILALLLIVAVGIGANIGMQKAKDQAKPGGTTGETTNTPSTQKAESMQFIPIVLRVSGDQGTRYHCIYNTQALEEGEIVSYSTSEDGTLGRQPVDYDAQIVSESSNRRPPSGQAFRANCSIGPPSDPSSGNTGRLRAEVLVNNAVKDSDETRPDPPNKTSTQGTSVTVEYFEPCDGPLPKGKGKVDAKVKGKDYC